MVYATIADQGKQIGRGGGRFERCITQLGNMAAGLQWVEINGNARL